MGRCVGLASRFPIFRHLVFRDVKSVRLRTANSTCDMPKRVELFGEIAFSVVTLNSQITTGVCRTAGKLKNPNPWSRK